MSGALVIHPDGMTFTAGYMTQESQHIPSKMLGERAPRKENTMTYIQSYLEMQLRYELWERDGLAELRDLGNKNWSVQGASGTLEFKNSNKSRGSERINWKQGTQGPRRHLLACIRESINADDRMLLGEDLWKCNGCIYTMLWCEKLILPIWLWGIDSFILGPQSRTRSRRFTLKAMKKLRSLSKYSFFSLSTEKIVEGLQRVPSRATPVVTFDTSHYSWIGDSRGAHWCNGIRAPVFQSRNPCWIQKEYQE